ncbi:MAG: AAA family ATPase [Deltaproteobacteria bacterium]|uniref:AAA family ATPase n=1 Tax=Desulfobacula sp. TaxID=2593537 RepID=UPI00199563D7|nr:AAA family ATPase [Candidatus Desulfobacula maris]MBL6992390.1 AAA family ATPase [Desulfobacula sp.]
MKLRKALDKAKDERELNGRELNGKAAPEEIISGAGGSQVDSDTKADKRLLIYTESNKRLLNPAVTEKNRGVCLSPNPAEIERYKILRTRINHQSADKPMNTVMITSANRGEGKTVTCINMGFTFARELNHTVFIVDCDFKGQDIHRYLGIESKNSLIDYFLDDVPLNNLIIWPGVEKLTLISGDRTVFDSSELLSSDMMAKLVKEMGNRYSDRYVFFDAPPILERSEAIAMAPLMDGILMVVEAGVTSKKDVRKAVELLPKDKFLGFVLNKQG